MASFAGISSSQEIHGELMRAPSESDIEALCDVLQFDTSAAASQAGSGMKLQKAALHLEASQLSLPERPTSSHLLCVLV